MGLKSTARHYETIKFSIKILLNTHNVQFCGALCAQSFYMATLRAERAENLGIVLTFAPPPPPPHIVMLYCPSEKWIDFENIKRKIPCFEWHIVMLYCPVTNYHYVYTYMAKCSFESILLKFQINFENIKRKIQRIISDSCFQFKSWFNVDARAPSIPLLNFPFNRWPPFTGWWPF